MVILAESVSRLARDRRIHVFAVAALGATMVAATLVVGLDVDGRNPGTERHAAPHEDGVARLGLAIPAPAAGGRTSGSTTIAAQRGSVAAVTVRTSGSLPKDGQVLKIVSAHGDLTGQRELAWAGDAGRRVGAARCTRQLRIGGGAAAGERPGTLLCWRTSATKSVYVLALGLEREPSERVAVAKLNAAWRSMR